MDKVWIAVLTILLVVFLAIFGYWWYHSAYWYRTREEDEVEGMEGPAAYHDLRPIIYRHTAAERRAHMREETENGLAAVLEEIEKDDELDAKDGRFNDGDIQDEGKEEEEEEAVSIPPPVRFGSNKAFLVRTGRNSEPVAHELTDDETFAAIMQQLSMA
jgi:hypothetical protein